MSFYMLVLRGGPRLLLQYVYRVSIFEGVNRERECSFLLFSDFGLAGLLAWV